MTIEREKPECEPLGDQDSGSFGCEPFGVTSNWGHRFQKAHLRHDFAGMFFDPLFLGVLDIGWGLVESELLSQGHAHL